MTTLKFTKPNLWLTSGSLKFFIIALIVFGIKYCNAQFDVKVAWGLYFDSENINIIPAANFQSDEELVDQVVIDKFGSTDEIYIVGRTKSVNANLTITECTVNTITHNITTGEKRGEVFLAKYNNAGTLLWAKLLGTDYTGTGSANGDYGYCIAIDHDATNNYVYVGGEMLGGDTEAFDGFVCQTQSPLCNSTVYHKNAFDNDDGFVAKYDAATGDLMRWTYVGGTKSGSLSKDQVLGITVLNHDVYITGYTESDNFGVGVSSFSDNLLNGTGDMFIARLNSCLQMNWFTYYGGFPIPSKNEGVDRAHGIKAYDDKTVSNNDYIVVSGTVESEDLGVGTGNIDKTYGGETNGLDDAFLMRWDINSLNTGPLWATYLGAANDERGRSIDIDGQGNIYFTGWTESTNELVYPCSSKVYQGSFGGGNTDAFVAKFLSSGQRKWVTYFGGNGNEEDNGIKYYLDPCGPAQVVIAGLTTSTNNIYISGIPTHQTLNGNGSTANADAFVASIVDFEPNCASGAKQDIRFSAYLGGSATEHNHNAIASYGPYVDVGKTGYLYVSFSTESNAASIQYLDGIPTLLGTYTAGYSNTCPNNYCNTDAFLEKLSFQYVGLPGGNPCRISDEINKEGIAQMTIKAFPNPFETTVSCDITSGYEGIAVIEVINMYGERILEVVHSLFIGENKIKIELSNQNSGIYFLRVTSNNQSSITKIIKQ